MKSTAIQNHGWGGVFLAATLTATLLALFSGCKNPTSSSWEEPVRDYFEKYTNTAAIEKHEINAESIKDKNDTSCVSSDGAKTLTFYLRNPREYTLITDFPPANDTGVTIEQDRQDKTIIRVTYPQAYLQENEGGGQIGGTIRLTEDETLREFDSYSFSLKCNTPPPAVTRQCVNASNSTNTYWVCFWLPTAELANPIHADGRTVQKTKRIRVLGLFLDDSQQDFIKGQTGAYISAIKPDFATVSWTSENSAVATISEGGALNAVAKGSATIVATASYGGKTVSKQMTVYVHEITVSGGDDVTELFVGGATATFTVTPDSPDGRSLSSISYTWTAEGSAASISSGSSGPSRTASPVSAGTTTLTCTTTLYGMQITLATKTIKVYELKISGNTVFQKKSGTYTLSKSLTTSGGSSYSGSGITYTWQSGTPATATITNAGVLTTVAGGSTQITLTAKRGSTTLCSATKTIYVVEVTGCTTFIKGETPRALTITPTSISGYTYTLSPTSTAYATVEQSTKKITARQAGNTTLRLTVQRNSSDYINIDIPITIVDITATCGYTKDGVAQIAKSTSFALSATTSTLPTGATITYSSSAPSTASYSATTGKITSGSTAGTSTITARITMSDGSYTEKEILTVNVVDKYTVPFSELDDLLDVLPENDADTPHKIKITNLTASDITQTGPYASDTNGLRKELRDHSNIYVDLSSTTLPNDLTNMENAFRYCDNLVYAPEIPPTCTNMMTCFHLCSNLKAAPQIPDSVTNMISCFYDCTSLSGIVIARANITDASYWNSTFCNCSGIIVFVLTNEINAAVTSATQFPATGVSVETHINM